MIAIPALERVGVLRPEEQAANSSDRHFRFPRLGSWPPRPQRLSQRALVEIVELAADRKPMRQLTEADRKSLQALGEVMSRGLALQSRVHRQHHLVDPALRHPADQPID